jgi:predicted nuclease with TOPRIM domain
MKPLRLVVEYQSNDYTKRLEAEKEALRAERDSLKDYIRDLEYRFACEMHVNMELTDKLRDNGIPFRPIQDLYRQK